MLKHAVHGGDVTGLLARFSRLQEKAQVRAGRTFPIIVIQEAGRSCRKDGGKSKVA
jgi:transposase